MAEETCSAKFTRAVEKNACVVIETDVRTVRSANLFLCADNYCLGDCALLGVTARDCALDGNYDLVANCRIPMMRTAKHTDAEDLLCTAVVGNL